MSSPWLEGLNTAQLEAVTHGTGPLLVIAGAGTGKTRTLASRVAHLIDGGVDSGRILLLTFTRRAAAEMVERAARMVRLGGPARIWGGTFHAVANRLLRVYGQAVGLGNDFTVMDQGDAADMLNLLRGELGLAKNKKRFPQKATLIRIYSLTVNAGRKLRDVLERHFPWCLEDIEGIRRLFDAYVERKRQTNVLDYDDLLLHWRALTATEDVGRLLDDSFDHILVDEYQDTNPIQADILVGMRRRNRNIMVVGDDAQSIYSFRAATVRNILDFPSRFEGARIVTLEENYRSTTPILEASNAVMAPAKERYTKNLRSPRSGGRPPVLTSCLDEAEQSTLVVGRILEHLEQGIPLRRQAVLFRAGWHSNHLEIELTRRKIPFHKYGGLKFVEAAHVKDLLAMLRILENPHDQMSWYRVLLLLPGIGPRSARRLMETLGARGGRAERGGGPDGGPGPLSLLMNDPPRPPPAAREAFAGFVQALRDCCAGAGSEVVPAPADGDDDDRPPPGQLPVATQVEILRRFYDPILQETYENPAVRMRDIEQLQQIAAGYRSRGRFITDLTLDPPTSTADLAADPFLEEDWLVLSTIHSAKGCEWDVVHIIHAADGMIPSDMAVEDEAGVEEERRLLYVAMTRAKDFLYLYFPLRYYHRKAAFGDAHSYAQVSRFITPEVMKCLEVRSAPVGREPRDRGWRANPGASHRLRNDLRRLFND